MNPSIQVRPRGRRGAGLAAVILMLAVLNIAAVGVLAAGAEESDVGVSRAETIRALYAAESGCIAVIKLSQSGQALPAAGSVLSLNSAEATYDTVPAGSEGGTLLVVGESGGACRRIEVVFEVQ